MATNVSANTLFNFMEKFEYLKMVLDKKFHPRYYKEDLQPFFKLPVFIAMKCFCDIPLSLVSEHTNTYGKYAIGLTKDWGTSHGLSPITYFNNTSMYIQSIKDGYNANIDIINSGAMNNYNTIYNLGKVKNSLQQSFLNYKPIYGRMWRNGDWKRDINFYNEREWRYIPPTFINREDNFDTETIKNFYTTEELYILSDDVVGYKHNMNKQIKLGVEQEVIEGLNALLSESISIDFDYNDINFIIVQSDNEIIELCNYIDNLRKDKDKANILKTKIMKYSDIDTNV